jgi:transposase-like protein
VRDRNGNTADFILEHSDDGSIAQVMLPILDYDVLLCSDSKSSYKSFADVFDFTHKTINASDGEHVTEGAYHIQNVNAYDSRLKRWMIRFHGVSTKYLESYLGWMRMLDRESNITSKDLLNHGVSGN